MKTLGMNIEGVTVSARVVLGARGLVWRYKFRYPTGRGGRPHKGTLGAADLLTRAMVRRLLAEKVREAMSGPAAPQVRLSQAIEQYHARHGCRLAEGGQRDRTVLKALWSWVGDKPLDEVTLVEIEDYRARRLSTPRYSAAATDPRRRVPAAIVGPPITHGTMNREMTVIRRFFNKAILWGLCTRNPTKGIQKLREAPGRVRYLVEDEWARLVTATKAGPWWLYPACVIARLAGLRRGEILRLAWADVDLARAMMQVQNTKANRCERIPLHAAVVELLWGLPRDGAAVFGDHLGTTAGERMFDRAWRAAAAAAGLADLHFHDLRHDFASQIVMTGGGIETARVLLRHTDLRMTMRYAHLSPRHLRDAVDALRLDQAPAEPPAGGPQVVPEEASGEKS